ncbi:MAG: ABC transporter [Methylobacter sp.]|nr:MAG: ABC transporter [Methylobacter sp.]
MTGFNTLHRKLYFRYLAFSGISLAVLGVLAWLSTQYVYEADVTAGNSNTLSDISTKLLQAMPEPIEITAYIKAGVPLRLQIAQIIARYQRVKPNMSFRFVDPSAQPEKIRALNIGGNGALMIEYQGRSEKLTFVDEPSLSNALLQLANTSERWVTFLAGHGERSGEGQANYDLGRFGHTLAQRKIFVQDLNLAQVPDIPDNSNLLVISAPTAALLPGEIKTLADYLGRGGNLLVLAEPNTPLLDKLLTTLGISRLTGELVDTDNKLYGIDDPGFIVTGSYNAHPVLKNFQTLTLFPTLAALTFDKGSSFQASALLTSSNKTWTETGEIDKSSRFDKGTDEVSGPLDFAFALTRTLGDKQQRIIVVGDGDFLSNAYLGNAGNMDLGLRLVNWLVHNDNTLDIPAKNGVDDHLQLSQTAVAVIGFGFLIVLPLALFTAGFIVWRSRKRL